jgi:hypothetical protein
MNMTVRCAECKCAPEAAVADKFFSYTKLIIVCCIGNFWYGIWQGSLLPFPCLNRAVSLPIHFGVLPFLTSWSRSCGLIAILISTLGSKLVQSRLKESKNIKPGETRFIKESKEDIKRKIDKIEDLNSQELDLLLNIIVSTHNTLQLQQQQGHIQSSNSSNIEGKEKNQNNGTQ